MSTAEAVQSPAPTTIDQILPADQRAANRAANFANAVTGVYGISGSGKSSLADTAAEYAWESFQAISLCYAADLGGFGNKRLALIRAGIIRVWDPRNHVDPFATMELASLGAWPERLIDPETGYAAPDVRLILPRRVLYTLICPQGHVVSREEDQRKFYAATFKCPECGVNTNHSNAQRIEQTVVKHPLFQSVGHRIYDGFTALNEWGLNELQAQSAAGKLPINSTGGSALGGADALVSGTFKFSTGSKAQYGFLQSRTYSWLSNIKTIPDQVVPATCTFMVEASRSDDESGGEAVLGPKIAGSARTSSVPGWIGNCLHATKEPNDAGIMVHRLWMTNHIDRRDPRNIPYLAKHRGTPIGMPDYLEDVPGQAPWSGCSLKVFYELLNTQLAAMEAEQASKYPGAPGMWTGNEPGVEEVVVVLPTAGQAAGVSNAAGVAGAVAPTGGQAVTATPVVGGARGGLRRRAVAAPVSQPVTVPLQAAPAAQPPQIQTVAAAQVGAATVPAASSPIAVAEAVPGDGAPNPITPTAAPSASPVVVDQITTGQAIAAPVTTSSPQPAVAPAATQPPSGVSSSAATPAGARPLRRLARPPA